ncbi:MAG: hypothetical protein ABW198_03585 [Pseudorhodoplanes sp.]
MRPPFRIAIAAGVLVFLSGVAMAQQHSAPRNSSHRIAPQAQPAPQPDRGYSYEKYGLGTACDSHPFASGCDKRGFW